MESKKSDKKIIVKEKPASTSPGFGVYKLLVVPVLLAFTLRYLPFAFYGNRRVYEKSVPLAVIDDFLPEDKIEELQQLIKRERRFATAVEASMETGVTSMGEHVKVKLDGSCPELDMFSVDGVWCTLGGRYDIFKHFAVTGGFWGAKETVEKLFSSIFTFINYYPELVEDPVIKELFEMPEYNEQIDRICSEGYGHDETKKMVFHPLQVNIVMMPPGQDLPLHQDNQWFWHVNQRSAPDWLLHVMHESRLFEKEMIPQAQGVAYLHGTKEKPYFEHGGRYIYYPNGPGAEPQAFRPKRGQAIVMDGGRTIHGVERTHPGTPVGRFLKGKFNRIEYQGNETWYAMSDDDIIDTYTTDQFRQTFVWRGLCFESDEKLAKFKQILADKDYTPIPEILKVLEKDLQDQGTIKQTDTVESMGHLNFGRLLMKKYMQYPLTGNEHTMWIPVNYCALGYKKPWLNWLLSPFCDDNNNWAPLNDKVPPAKEFCDPRGRTSRDTNCIRD